MLYDIKTKAKQVHGAECNVVFFSILKKCNMKKVQQEKSQHAKSVTEEECKTKTFKRVTVQHEIVQYIKRMQYEKKSNMKRLLHKKVQYGNDAV